MLFVSYEPMIGQVDNMIAQHDGPKVDLVVCGGESGPHARPCNLEWIRSTIRQCREAGVACFVKQVGSHVHIDTPGGTRKSWFPNHSKGGDPEEWDTDLRVREFPAKERQLP